MNEMHYEQKIKWQDIALHDGHNIRGFFGPFKFLSNFEPCMVYGIYPSTENAYMAEKVVPEERKYFTTCTAAEAKRAWKHLKLIDKSGAEWDKRKVDVMKGCLHEKFVINIEFRQKLIDTGDRYLEETNWWGDVFWGVDIQKGGENHLGKLLMDIRSTIQAVDLPNIYNINPT